MIDGRCKCALVLASSTLTCYALTVRLVAATLSPLDVVDDAKLYQLVVGAHPSRRQLAVDATTNLDSLVAAPITKLYRVFAAATTKLRLGGCSSRFRDATGGRLRY